MHAQDDQGYTTLDIVKQSADDSFRESFSSYLGQVALASYTSQERGLLEAIRKGDSEATKTLLGEGVDPLQADADGSCALILAVKQGNLAAVQQLLKSKAEEQLVLKDLPGGNTALHQAVLTDNLAIVKKLLEFSQDVEDRQSEGKTALFLAVENARKKTIQILLSHSPSARLFTQCNAGNTPVHIAANLNNDILRLILHGKDAARCLKHRNKSGETPIWHAVRHGNVESFQVLHGSGASLRMTNKDHENLLHLMARQNSVEFLAKTIYAFQASDVQSRNRWNDTPLTIAERNDFSEIVTLLRKKSEWPRTSKLHKIIAPNEAPPKPSKLFYTLSSEPKWVKKDSGGYWRHLTYNSYQVYERIFVAAMGGKSGPLTCKQNT